MGRSFKARIISAYIRAIRMTVKSATNDINDETDKMHYDIPSNIKFPRPVIKRMCGEMEIFEAPSDGKSELTFIYIHGGAYNHQFTPYHWKFLADIAEQTGCAFTTPNYPMTPKYTWKESHEMVMNYYKEFVQNHDMNKVIIGGDSAGGGFVLSLLQQAKTLGLPLPAKMVLISPYVDITRGVDKYDAMIECNALLVYGKAWANGLDLQDPIVSPYYGDMKDLPKTSLWIGTWEVLYEENVKLCEKLKESGVEVEFHVGEEMGHVYPLYPISEAESARKEIVKFMLN